MSFASIKKVFRSWFKPGIGSFNFAVVPPDPKTYPAYENNEPADPLCDNFGNQWIRDANLPNPYTSNQSLDSTTVNAFLGVSRWEIFRDVDICYPGSVLGLYPAGIFQVIVTAGDPAVTWDTSPLYLQMIRGFSAVNPPTSGVSEPSFVMPLPRPPEAAIFDAGVRLPFVGAAAGIAIALSSTRDVYTAPGGGLTGTFNVNYAQFVVN